MEIFGINFGALLQDPVSWIGLLIGGVILLPVFTLALDQVTNWISDAALWVNYQIVDKIPIKQIKDWLQQRQVTMLEKSIVTYQNTIKKIKEK